MRLSLLIRASSLERLSSSSGVVLSIFTFRSKSDADSPSLSFFRSRFLMKMTPDRSHRFNIRPVKKKTICCITYLFYLRKSIVKNYSKE